MTLKEALEKYKDSLDIDDVLTRESYTDFLEFIILKQDEALQKISEMEHFNVSQATVLKVHNIMASHARDYQYEILKMLQSESEGK